MPSPTVKLQTNIPITGILKYCDFKKSDNPDWKDQITLRGEWEGYGDGRIYLPIALEGELQTLGVIGSRQPNGNFQVLLGSPKIKLTKADIGNNRQKISVELLGNTGTRAAPPTQTAQQSAPQIGSLPAGPALSNEEKKTRWEQLIFTMAACMKAAKKLWTDEDSAIANQIAISSTANYLFVSSVSMGLLRTPPGAAQPAQTAPLKHISLGQTECVAQECIRLRQDEAWLSKTLVSFGYPSNLESLTETQATALIASLATIPTPPQAHSPTQTEDIPF